MIPTREEAWTILKKYNDSEALLRHALTVEGCMRHFAELAGEDPELWGAVGCCTMWITKNIPISTVKKRRSCWRKRAWIPW